jgi:hypothetical protein
MSVARVDGKTPEHGSPSWRVSRRLKCTRYRFTSMGNALGRRLRWILVVVLVAAWFVALALDVGGNGVHLLLAAAVAVLLYELVALDTPS